MPTEFETHYSPAQRIGCELKRVSGNPDAKLANHAAAVALNFFAYNFIKIHQTLRMSPAMAAKVTDRLWEVKELVAMWGEYEKARKAA